MGIVGFTVAVVGITSVIKYNYIKYKILSNWWDFGLRGQILQGIALS